MRELKFAQDIAGEIAAGARKRQRDMLGSDMSILAPIGFIDGQIQNVHRRRRKARGALLGSAGVIGSTLDLLDQTSASDARLLKDERGRALGIGCNTHQQMFW